MIKPKHTPFYRWLSVVYSRFFLNIAFRKIKFLGDSPEDSQLPIIMIANHFSWWDGFIQILLNSKVFKKTFYFMMLEEEIIKNPVLSKAGACSVSKGSRNIIETLKHLIEVIQNPNNIYLFFPQGEIQSLYTFPFKFEKGSLSYILKKTKNDFQLVMNVNLIDYSSFKRPELSVYYKTYQIKPETTADDIENDYNGFAEECLDKQKNV